MKTVCKNNCIESKKATVNDRLLAVFAISLSLSMAQILALLSLDCEKYSSADTLEKTSITYEKPDKADEKGFWDIFCDSVMGLFSES